MPAAALTRSAQNREHRERQPRSSSGLDESLTWHHKVLMNTLKRTVAATELLLIFPATLFMAALFVRNLQPQQYEPAHSAQRIVMWYASRTHVGLWLFLITLPLAVLVTGCTTLLRNWQNDPALREAARQTSAAIRAHLATIFVAVATVTAGGILAIVALHVLTD
jgi:hypothetical protein